MVSTIVRPQRAHRNWLPLAFFLAFFILNGILGSNVLNAIDANRQEQNSTLRNIATLNRLYLEVLLAETGQRGYLLTDTSEYLLPYSQAVSILETELADPRALDLDEEQVVRYERFSGLIREKLAELASTVSSANANRQFEAIQQVFTNRGFVLMDALSGVVDEMLAYENQVLVERQASTERSRILALYMIIAANLLGVLMVLIVARLARKARTIEELYVKSLQDATETLELKVAERTERLQHYSNELKRSNRELEDFAFVASHDLQEPLRKIQAFGDRLETGLETQLQEQEKDYLRRMRSAASRMSQLIEDLLSISRITSKAQPFIKVSLLKVIEYVFENLELVIEESDAQFEIESLPEIEADPSQMRQLFQNLIGNALKFRKPDQTPHISIRVRNLTEPISHFSDWVDIEVSDNGIGFDSGHAEMIFKPFQRLHGRDQYAGTGIGLAICRRIVERHGGTITASSTEGQGTIFSIRLPLKNSSISLNNAA